jgi:hypothetical protein
MAWQEEGNPMKSRFATLLLIGIFPAFAQDQSVGCIAPNTQGFRVSTTGPDGQTSTRILYPTGDNVGTRPPATLVADSKNVVDAVVMMKGNVEIRTSSIILKADAAEYHLCTGEIVARGNVLIKPVPAE